jgi:hypothetical protein
MMTQVAATASETDAREMFACIESGNLFAE